MKNEKIVLMITLVLGFILRILPLRTYHGWDECVYLQHADIFFTGINNYSELSFRAPFLSYLFYLGDFILYSPYMAHIIVGLTQVLGIYFIYLLGKELYDEKVGLISAVFLGFTPFFLSLGNSLLPGMTSVSFMIISFYLLIKKDNFWYAFFCGVFLAIAGLTKHPALFLGIVYLVMFLIKKISFKQMFSLGLGFLVSMFPYFIWAQIKFGFFLAPFLNHAKRNFTGEILNNLGLYLVGLFEIFEVIVLIGLLLYFYKRRKDNYLVVYGVWILAYILVMLKFHAEVRYLIHIVPPVLLMSAKGFVNHIKNKKLFFGLIILVLVVGFSYEIYKDGFDLRRDYDVEYEITKPVIETSLYLKEFASDEDILYVNDNYPLIAYYSKKETKPIWIYGEFQDYYPKLLDKEGYIVYTYTSYEENKEFFDSTFEKVYENEEVYVYAVQAS